MIDLSKARPLNRSEVIHVDAWGADVYVQEMTGRQLNVLKKHVEVVDGVAVTQDELGLVLVLSLVDENGQYLFTENDIPALLDQPLSVTSPLFGKAVEMSGLSNMGVVEAKKNLKNRKSRFTGG